MVRNEYLELLETLTFMFVFVKEIFGSVFVGSVIFLGVVSMFKLFVCMYFFKGIRLYVFFNFQTS